MKKVGTAKVITTECYNRKDGTQGVRCVAMTDDSQVTIFYRPGKEEPQKGTEYEMLLAYDRNLSAVIRYQKVGA